MEILAARHQKFRLILWNTYYCLQKGLCYLIQADICVQNIMTLCIQHGFVASLIRSSHQKNQSTN